MPDAPPTNGSSVSLVDRAPSPWWRLGAGHDRARKALRRLQRHRDPATQRTADVLAAEAADLLEDLADRAERAHPNYRDPAETAQKIAARLAEVGRAPRRRTTR